MRYMFCATIMALLPCLAGAQDRVIAVPEKVKTEGLPPIPQAIADDLSRYASFREAQFVAWNPAKPQILIQTAFGSVPQLHLVDGPGRARTQLTFFPDGISREFAWAQFDPADGATVVLRKDAGGGKGAQPVLSLRRSNGRDDAGDRRPVAVRRAGLVAAGDVDRGPTPRSEMDGITICT